MAHGCIDFQIYMFRLFILCCATEVVGNGLLLLYRPRDISYDCAQSQSLRYDISYGMGMSDTITLVFRTMTEIDYQCLVDINTEAQSSIIIVIKYPTGVSKNCFSNQDAFTVVKKNNCIRLCDSVNENVLSSYYTVATRGRFRFQFLSNSSINSDLGADVYQVTATSARTRPKWGCAQRNETMCRVADADFCFTSGVVCDGINNCGVNDWFDERKSDCSLSLEKLGVAPVIAVVAVILCALLASGHILLQCLPPLANSFFVFNANEDNRLCIDPVFKSTGVRIASLDRAKRISLIPVSSSSSSDTEKVRETPPHNEDDILQRNTTEGNPLSPEEVFGGPNHVPDGRKMTLKSMTKKFQKKFRSRTTVMHV